MSDKIHKMSEIGHLVLGNMELMDGIETTTSCLESEMHKKWLFINKDNVHKLSNRLSHVMNIVISTDCIYLLSDIHNPVNVWVIPPNKFEEVRDIFK